VSIIPNLIETGQVVFELLSTNKQTDGRTEMKHVACLRNAHKNGPSYRKRLQEMKYT